MDEEEEHLDYEEDGDEEQLLGDDEDEQLLEGDDEAGYEDADAPQDYQEAEEDELAGLGDAVDDDTMQDNMPASNGHAADEHMQDQEGQQQQEEHDSKQEQDGQASKARKGKLCDLTQPSKRWDLIKSPKDKQQQQQQQQQKPQPQVQQGRAPISKPTPSSSLRGPLRYFMLRSVNTDNWDIAQQQGVWGTQPHNEAKFNEAFRKGCEVVFFLSAGKAATCIHGYGRMCSLSGQAPKVPWLDIDRNKVNNFHVSWDCTTPINYHAVEHLKNPWCDPRQGALSKGEPRPLKRHIDGHELAPQVGEQLLEAMNSNAAKAGKPASGPLSQGIRRGAGAAAARPGWPQQQPQQHPGMGPQQQQMHMQQQRLMMQQQRGGGMPGRGMMGGPHAGMGMGPGGPGGPGPMGPNRGPLAGGLQQQQQQPPPPMSGRMQPGGRPPGGPLASDPRLNPRFAGRLRMDPADDFPPGGGPYRSRGSPTSYNHRGDSREDWERERLRGDGRDGRDGRDRRYEGEHEWDRERDREERHRSGHGSRSRRHSRSRSRSPPRAASSRGGSTGRPGGAGVVESSFGSPAGRRTQQQQQADEEESVQDMSYEQYLATWEKVQARLKRLEATQQPQEQQLQLALVPAQQQQQVPNDVMGMRGAGVRGAAMGVDVGSGMLAGGGGYPSPPGGVLWPGMGTGAAGVGVDGAAVEPARPAGNPQIPTLAEYMQRIKARCLERGQPIPADSVMVAKYQDRMAQLQQGGQQQQQRMPPAPQQQQQLAMSQGMGSAGAAVGMMGMGPGMAPMNMAMNAGMNAGMNPMDMMATAMAAAAATNMMGMMGQGMGGAMMGPGGGAGGMVGPGAMAGGLGPMQMQQHGGMGGPGGQMMGRGGGRGGRVQMMPMQQQMGGGF